MAVVLEDSDSFCSSRRAYGDLKVKRTEAMPKNTLFGTTLERLSENEKQGLQELDINKFQSDIEKERRLRERRYKLTLPDHLQGQIPDEPLKISKQELMRQEEEASRAAKQIGLLEEKSRYFALDARERRLPSSPRKHRESGWMSHKDIEHAKDINSFGTCSTTGRNNDKYLPWSTKHSDKQPEYEIQYGMDYPFSMSSTGKRPYYQVEHVGPPDRLPREFYMKKDSTSEKDTSAVKLPPNIKHQFGTKICQQVLSDPDKVTQTLESQRKQKESLLRINQPRRREVILENDLNPEYQSLGAVLRQDFFPGHTMNHKKSVTKTDFADDVFNRRVPVPDEYKYRRDELSMWNEYNVVREKLKKTWEAYMEDQHKIRPNTAQAHYTIRSKTKQEKPKSKPKGSKKKPKKDGIPFEDIEFKTPPLTTSPVPETEKVIANKVERDKEFWNMYDEGV